MLKKWFIPNYQNVESASVRNRYGTVASFFGIFTNVLLGIMKLVIGFLSNSVTILADATNNLSDMIASIITLVGFRFSAKRPSKEHPYGYARYEYIANLFVSLFIFFIGLFFAKESFEKILHPSSLTIDVVTYLVLIVAVLVKGIQMMVYLDFGRRIDSDTLKATAMDSRNDMLSTLAILLSMIVMQVFHINIDGYTALLISFFVIYSAISLLQKALFWFDHRSLKCPTSDGSILCLFDSSRTDAETSQLLETGLCRSQHRTAISLKDSTLHGRNWSSTESYSPMGSPKNRENRLHITNLRENHI